MLMKFNKDICLEKDGIKVGDIINYKGYYGYVAVIDYDYPNNNEIYLLRLKNYEGSDKNFHWDEKWYPKKEKIKENNCCWHSINEFRVIQHLHINIPPSFYQWYSKHTNPVPKPKKKKDIIIECKTKQDWDNVLFKMIEEGYKWNGTRQSWNKKENCICIMEEDHYEIKYDKKENFRFFQSHIKIIQADKYLYPTVNVYPNQKTHIKVNTQKQKSINKPKFNLMNCALEVIKKLRLTTDEKLLIEYNCIDQNKNWLDQGIDSILLLESEDRGFKSFQGVVKRFTNTNLIDQDLIGISPFELSDLVKKHLPLLIESLKKDKASKKK